MSDAAAVADLRLTIEQIERRVEGAHGRLDSMAGRLNAMDDRIQRLTTLTQEALTFSSSQMSEVLRTLSTTEEHLHSMKRAFEVMTEQQGRMLRELAELQRSASHHHG